MRRFKNPAILFTLLAITPLGAWAAGAGSAAGLTLLKNSGARSSSLGEAFTAMTGDVTAMTFNPASLGTLEFNEASLHHEEGLFDDSFNKAMVGILRPSGVVGVSAGYYNSGKATLYDGVNPERSVVAQEDVEAGLGYGFRIKSAAWGAAIRYLKSDLAETNSASALSGDVGLQFQLATKLRAGVSGPLYQSKLKYASTGEELPRVYRAGVQWNASLPLATGALPVQFLFDVPYYANDRDAAFAAGAETHIGLLAFRLGFNSRSDIQQFSVGAGFRFQRLSLDYSFGLAGNSDVSSVQKINLSMQFGRSASELKALVGKRPERSTYQVYQVKEGETLESIALTRFGATVGWSEIFSLNRHLYSSPDEIKPGCRIVVPARKGT